MDKEDKFFKYGVEIRQKIMNVLETFWLEHKDDGVSVEMFAKINEFSLSTFFTQYLDSILRDDLDQETINKKIDDFCENIKLQLGFFRKLKQEESCH